MNGNSKLLEIHGLRVEFDVRQGVAIVINDLNISLERGKVLGIVGESGCGKSMLALSIMGLVPSPPGRVAAGRILLEGEDLALATEKRMRQVRGNDIAMIFQEPMTSLNPVFKIGHQIAETLRVHQGLDKKAGERRAVELLKAVDIPAPEQRSNEYPYQLSGGMRQRVMIAMALACNPKLLIADEPTTALDVTVQAQIFDLLKNFQKQTEAGLIFITHDMGSIAEMADQVAVMYAGRKVEDGPVGTVLSNPLHPYTRALISCVPHLEKEPSPERGPLIEIPGVVPSLILQAAGCPFASRCTEVMGRCTREMPPTFEKGAGHIVACWLEAPQDDCREVQQAKKPENQSSAAVPKTGVQSENDKEKEVLLSVRDLKVHFQRKRKHPFAKPSLVHAVDGVSFDVKRGTTLGLVGESGSGKTTAALAVTRLVDISGGKVTLDGDDITAVHGEALRLLRRRMQFIFQDPYSSLNPHQRAGAIVREAMDLLKVDETAKRDSQVGRLFQQVGLRPEQRAYFPHQFSGGQRQRIGVARALASRPLLIVCDEPVSALDVAIQAQILNLLRNLQQEYDLTFLFISHDLGVVQYICDEIAVMYSGKIVEQADRISLFKRPLHPYTWALLSAVPSAKPGDAKRDHRIQLVGDPPSPIDPPPGCRFAKRCPFSEATPELCRYETPPLREIFPGHKVACHQVTNEGKVPQEKYL